MLVNLSERLVAGHNPVEVVHVIVVVTRRAQQFERQVALTD